MYVYLKEHLYTVGVFCVFKMQKSSQQTSLLKIIIPPARGSTPASVSEDSEMEVQSAQTDKRCELSHFTIDRGRTGSSGGHGGAGSSGGHGGWSSGPASVVAMMMKNSLKSYC